MIKRILKLSLLLVVAIIFICNISFAENNVKSIAIEVIVNDDGSAKITQKWSGTFDEGTECFLPIDKADFEVSNLSVTMGNKNFKNIEWDINKSFEEKSYKCGINKTDTGVELCFGISKMGKNTYTFSYDVSRLVSAYSDYDGFNYTFVNPNMDYFPTNVEWKLKLKSGKKLTSNNCKISCSGYEGTAEIKNGIAVAKSIQSLNGNQYFDVTMQFDKGIIKSQQLPKDKSSLKSQIENAKLVTEYSKDTLVEDMDTVTFGSYPQSDITGNTKDPIEWIVLERDEENKKALLFSKYILDCKCYDKGSDNGFWNTCTLRDWLNEEFYHIAFNSDECSLINTTLLINSENEVDKNSTNDKIFCLSGNEIIKYFYFEREENRRYYFYDNLGAKGTTYARNIDNGGYTLWVDSTQKNEGSSCFWVRSLKDKNQFINENDDEDSENLEKTINTNTIGVRPALWVSYGSEDDKNNTGTVNVDSNKNLENAYETWDDNMFNESSYTYNHKVARISAMLSEAAYTESKIEDILLNKFKFTKIKFYNYDYSKSMKLDYHGTNCFSVAHKKINNNSAIFVISVRGTKTIGEIIGDAVKYDYLSGQYVHNMNNVAVYDHIYDFYRQIKIGVENYFDENSSLKNIKNLKILITGHSLGGASANCYAADLIANIKNYKLNSYLEKNDIFTYTFGAIKVFLKRLDENIFDSIVNKFCGVPNYAEGYMNIFNIYNHYDSFGPHGNYAWTNVSSPYQKFGMTYKYTDERLHFDEINEPHLYEINSVDVITILPAIIKSIIHAVDDDAKDFVGTFYNHDMTNYMAALNLYDFSKIRNTNQEEAAQEAKQNNGNNLKEQIRNAKLVTEYAEDTLVDNIDTVVFGSYPQSDITGDIKEPIEWIVLDRQEDKALLLSKYILDSAKFNDEINNLWETSSLRMWMND